MLNTSHFQSFWKMRNSIIEPSFYQIIIWALVEFGRGRRSSGWKGQIRFSSKPYPVCPYSTTHRIKSSSLSSWKTLSKLFPSQYFYFEKYQQRDWLNKPIFDSVVEISGENIMTLNMTPFNGSVGPTLALKSLIHYQSCHEKRDLTSGFSLSKKIDLKWLWYTNFRIRLL